MTKLRNLLMIGAAVTAVAAAVTGPALAHALKYHEMDVRTPFGTVEHIRYAGDTPPEVRFDAQPVADIFNASPFVEMERISAAMDRQTNELWRMADPRGLFDMTSPQAIQARLGSLPPGTEGYSVATFTTAGGKTCVQKMTYDYTGHGQPQIEKTASGDCAAGAAGAGNTPASVQAKSPVEHALKHDWKVIEAAL